MVLLNGEVPPQVEQRGLTRTVADPLALDQSIGEVAFAGSGIVGVGATYTCCEDSADRASAQGDRPTIMALQNKITTKLSCL